MDAVDNLRTTLLMISNTVRLGNHRGHPNNCKTGILEGKPVCKMNRFTGESTTGQ